MNTLRFAFIIKEMEVRIKQPHGQGKLLPLSLLLLLLGAAAARSLGSRLSLFAKRKKLGQVCGCCAHRYSSAQPGSEGRGRENSWRGCPSSEAPGAPGRAGLSRLPRLLGVSQPASCAQTRLRERACPLHKAATAPTPRCASSGNQTK